MRCHLMRHSELKVRANNQFLLVDNDAQRIGGRFINHSTELDIGQHEVVTSERDSLVGSAKSCGIIGTLIKLQLASVFVCFHSLLPVHLLNFLARSCEILQIRGFLGKNLTKILTKKTGSI